MRARMQAGAIPCKRLARLRTAGHKGDQLPFRETHCTQAGTAKDCSGFLTASLRSCPQAAAASRPRVVRADAGMPSACSTARKRCNCAPLSSTSAQPSQRLSARTPFTSSDVRRQNTHTLPQCHQKRMYHDMIVVVIRTVMISWELCDM